MLSADPLLIKHNMAAQHDLGTGWHAAFCAAEPRCGSDLAFVQLLNTRGEEEEEWRRRREVDWADSAVFGSQRRQRRVRKKRAVGRRWLSHRCVWLQALGKQSICHYWPCKQTGKTSCARLLSWRGPFSLCVHPPFPSLTLLTPTRALWPPVGHRHCNLDSVDINCSGCKVSVSLRRLRGLNTWIF